MQFIVGRLLMHLESLRGYKMWLRPQGYAVLIEPDRPSKANLDGFQCVETREGYNEFDTLACGHCNRVVHVLARQRPEDIGGLCKQCMRCICPQCVGEGRCFPLEKRIEEWEEAGRRRRMYEECSR